MRKKAINWKNRGKKLETLIERTNLYYEKNKVSRVDKCPTPIAVVEVAEGGKITSAYYEKKSTVDFYGIAQGYFLAFDAKQTSAKSLSLKNIHNHQIDYMRIVTEQGGLAFIIVEFTKLEKFYLLPFEIVEDYYLNQKKGGRSSIPHSEFEKFFEIKLKNETLLLYLNAVNDYIDWKSANVES